MILPSRLAPLLLLAASAVCARAATITNPSFEANTFTTYPGYISGAANGAITGWSASDPTRVGINANPQTWVPTNATATPFANNGVTPDGKQSGFIQVATATPNTSLSTQITDLVPGTTYRVTFRMTSRNSGVAINTKPNALVTVGGASVSVQAAPVEATNTFTAPYRLVSVVFKASAATENLSIAASLLPAASAQTDSTMVVDDFRIAQGATQWKSSAWTGDATSGISSGLTYTHAFSVGSANSAVINGVNFTGVAAPAPVMAGSFSTTGWTTALADTANNLLAAGDGSSVLAANAVYGGASQTAQTITLEGLVVGTSYHLTLFGVGWADANVPNRSLTFDNGLGDSLTMNEQQFGADNGVKFEYDYIATGTSQTFTVNPTAIVSTFHLYGFANSTAAVPEPSAVLALTAAGLVLGLRRRRSQG